MSYTVNCRKCNTLFLKVSLKSKETVCHSCRLRNRNAMVAQPLEEMTKGELLRLLQDMQDRQEKMEKRLTAYDTKLGNMYNSIATSTIVKDEVKKAVEGIAPDMKMLYVKHNNRILKLEKEVFKSDDANTIKKK